MVLGKTRSTVLPLLVLAIVVCSIPHETVLASGVPDKLEDGWPVSTLQAGGFNATQIGELHEYIRNDSNADFKGLLVARNGKLVYEGYFNGHNRALLHDIRSATKSLTSSLVGIAIKDGLVSGVDASIVNQLSKVGMNFQDEVQ